MRHKRRRNDGDEFVGVMTLTIEVRHPKWGVCQGAFNPSGDFIPRDKEGLEEYLPRFKRTIRLTEKNLPRKLKRLTSQVRAAGWEIVWMQFVTPSPRLVGEE